jgi:uncharacterized RDD family membrane protein YckC
MAESATKHVNTLYPAVATAAQGERAGVVTRTIVMMIDALIVVSVTGIGYLWWSAILFVIRPRTFSWPDPPQGSAYVAAYALAVIYLTVSWATSGRSYGKRLLGVRVLGRRDRPMGLVVAFLRANLCIFFPLTLFWSAFSRENRSVADLIFRTSVIYDWRSKVFTGPEASDEDAVGVGVDVAAPVADEPNDGDAEAVAGTDGE